MRASLILPLLIGHFELSAASLIYLKIDGSTHSISIISVGLYPIGHRVGFWFLAKYKRFYAWLTPIIYCCFERQAS